MSRRYYMASPEMGYYPVQPMVYYQDNGMWTSGYTLQRGRLQHRHSDLSDRYRQPTVNTLPKQRPVNRVIPQQQQQQIQQQQQQMQQQREGYIKNQQRGTRSASPTRRVALTEDKIFAFNSLKKDVKTGMSALKHVAMDVPKLNSKTAPADTYKAMRTTLGMFERENKKWKVILNLNIVIVYITHRYCIIDKTQNEGE